MKKRVVFLWILLLSSILAAKEKVGPVPVVVAAAKSESGFSLGKDIEDSANDLTKQVKKSKLMTFTENAEDAVIVLRVISRESKNDGSSNTTTYKPLTGVQQQSYQTAYVDVELLVRGELVRVIRGAGSFTQWGVAARNAREQVEDFIELNHAKLKE